MAMEYCQQSAMVSLLIVLDVLSSPLLPPVERIAVEAATAATAAAEEMAEEEEDEDEEGRVSRTENVPGGDSRRTSLEVQKVRALQTRDSDIWSCLASWSSVLDIGAAVLGSSLLG